MDKPTVFLSYSSKDHAMVSYLKNRMEKITQGALNYFQSGDGLSIPYGREWVNHIITGLKQSSLVFVFVTPNSITSNWMHFEAGFAYSRNAKVVPVCFGLDVNLLKAPLSIFQGFNVTSENELNKLVAIVNEQYGYDFKHCFSEHDYSEILNCQDSLQSVTELEDIIGSLGYYLQDEKNEHGRIILSVAEFYEKIKTYLRSNGTSYSTSCKNSPATKEETIVVYGIKIVYRKQVTARDDITITLSLYNLSKSLPLCLNMIKLQTAKYLPFLILNLNPGYKYLPLLEDINAILSEYPREYRIEENIIGQYVDLARNMRFSIDLLPKHLNRSTPRVLIVEFISETTGYSEIRDFVVALLSKGVISRSS